MLVGTGYAGVTFLFQGTQWYQCGGATCFGYLYGISTYLVQTSAAYDAADGYVITAGGSSAFYNYALGEFTEFYVPYSWAFGQFLSSQGPGFTPTYVDLGQQVTFSLGATGGGTGSYHLDWSGLPTGCAPPSALVTSFTCSVDYPGFGQYGSSYTYGTYYDPSAVITDTSGFPEITTLQSSTWLNSLNVAPDPQIFLNSSASTAEVGQTVYFGLTGVDGWQPFTFSWSDLPPGCSVVNTTASHQLEKCVLGAGSVGSWLPYASLTDSAELTVSSPSLALGVYPASTATEVEVNSDDLDVGQTFSVEVAVSGGSGSYSYAWSSVPDACQADAAVLSCSVPANEAGTYSPSVEATDSVGVSVRASYSGSVVISPAPTATGINVTGEFGASMAALDAGQAVNFTLASTAGSGGDTVTWRGLPAGCAPSGGAATTVSCTPATAGSYIVSARVTDSNGASADASVTVTVNGRLTVSVAPTVSSASAPGSVAYTATVGGGTPPYSYAWTLNGSVVAGATASTFSLTGVGPGDYAVAATVTDSAGASASSAIASTTIGPEASGTAPFATSAQWLEIGLLLVLIVLAVVIILSGRLRPPRNESPPAGKSPPAPEPASGSSAPGAPAAEGSSSAPPSTSPSYLES